MKVVIAAGAGTQNRRRLSLACAAGEASVVAVARNGAEAIRTVLEEEPDVLILGPRLDLEEGLGVLHAVRPLLPVLRIVAVGERPGGELRRAFLLGEIDLLLAGPDWADVIPEVLRQWQHEQRREPWPPFTAAPPMDCG
jgi:chemotaxis response regulator CheB